MPPRMLSDPTGEAEPSLTLYSMPSVASGSERVITPERVMGSSLSFTKPLVPLAEIASSAMRVSCIASVVEPSCVAI